MKGEHEWWKRFTPFASQLMFDGCVMWDSYSKKSA